MRKILINCLICQREFKRYSTLVKHIINDHNIQSNEYYDEHIRKDKTSIKCVCGNLCKFRGIEKGYNIYCSSLCYKKNSKNHYKIFQMNEKSQLIKN